MRRKFLSPFIALLALAIALPAAAITNGEPDDGTYDYVGQLLFYVPDAVDPRFGPEDPGAWFTCSGTLIDENGEGNVVVTAGHCTFGVGLNGESTNTFDSPLVNGGFWGADQSIIDNGVGGNDVWVSFLGMSDFDILPPSTDFYDNPEGDGNPANDGNEFRYAAWRDALNGSDDWFRGTADPDPRYNDAAFYAFDLGVVTLDEAPDEPNAYGTLPEAGFLNEYIFSGKKKAHTQFTPVGFGLELGFPWYYGTDTRMTADVRIIDGRGVLGLGPILPGSSIAFSNNNGAAHRGGTCFGDSGGPTFFEDSNMIVAVTSFGVNQPCAGTGGGYRIDKDYDLNWIRSH